MADTELALIEKAVMDVVLSREGKRRYSNGDPLTLDPSDLRDIVRLTMAKCAALASRPAEVDDKRQWFVVGGRRVGRAFMVNVAHDAARYRWLRQLSNIEAASIVDFHSGDSMDVRVDQAMARAAAGQGSK